MKVKKNGVRKYRLSASLVCSEMLDLREEIAKLEKGGIDYIHFDVMDNQFVPRFGLYPEILKSIKKITKIPVDVHLMVNNPENSIPYFAQAGADIIFVHAEATNHLHHLINLIKSMGVKAGVAINPATSLNVLDYVLDNIDYVMLMAINPGILGHKLIPNMMDKIKELKNKLKKYPNIEIEIDGGVTFESGPKMIKNGAKILVCGSSTIYKPDVDIDVKIKEFRGILDKE